MRKATNYNISILQCTLCGKDMYVPRKKSRMRVKGHIKTMRCPVCQMKTDFKETGDTL